MFVDSGGDLLGDRRMPKGFDGFAAGLPFQRIARWEDADEDLSGFVGRAVTTRSEASQTGSD